MEYQYTASGGTPPYAFSISAGALPTGLTMDSEGLVTGNREAGGYFSWTVRGVDSMGLEGFLDDTAYVMDLLIGLDNGTVGYPYSDTVTAVYGRPPYVYSLVSGVLPDGLSLAANGSITGTPTTEEVQTFYIKATDAQNIEVTKEYEIEIAAAGVGGDIGDLIMPAFNGNEYNITRVNEHDASCGLEFVLFATGAFVVRKTFSAAVVTGSPLTGNWLSTPGAGAGDDYEVRFIGPHVTIGDVDGTVSEDIDTGWLPMTSDQGHSCQAFASSGSGANHTQIDYRDYTIKFRKVGQTATVDATIRITAEAETTS